MDGNDSGTDDVESDTSEHTNRNRKIAEFDLIAQIVPNALD